MSDADPHYQCVMRSGGLRISDEYRLDRISDLGQLAECKNCSSSLDQRMSVPIQAAEVSTVASF